MQRFGNCRSLPRNCRQQPSNHFVSISSVNATEISFPSITVKNLVIYYVTFRSLSSLTFQEHFGVVSHLVITGAQSWSIRSLAWKFLSKEQHFQQLIHRWTFGTIGNWPTSKTARTFMNTCISDLAVVGTWEHVIDVFLLPTSAQACQIIRRM